MTKKAILLESPKLIGVPEVFFETVELSFFRVPSLLYGVEPHGVGTGACESLKSYICRLADAHRNSSLLLIREVLNDKLIALKRNWPFDLRSLKSNRRYLSIGKNTDSIIRVLSEATGVTSLEYCTMLPLRGVLGVNGLLTAKERHCPLCLCEAHQNGKLYGHLIWEVASVTTCPVHGIQLIQSKCGASKEIYLKLNRRKILSGVCSSCGSIGYQCRQEAPIIALDAEIWKAQQVAKLVSYFPNANELFSQQNTINGLKLLVEKYADGKPAIAAYRAGMNKSVLWGWIRGRHTPSLHLLLDLCLSTGVSLVSVLSGSPSALSKPYFQTPLRRRTRKPSAEERENALKVALLSNPPQSLKAVARLLGIDTSMLRRKFPELSVRVIERYRQFSLGQTVERHQKARDLALRLIEELRAKGLPLTARNIHDVSGKSYRPRSLLYQAVNKAVAEKRSPPQKSAILD